MSRDPQARFPCRPAEGIGEIACTGLARQMGTQQGEALRDLAHRSIREVMLENDRVCQIKPRLLPRRLFLAAARWLAHRTVPRDVEIDYPRQYERFLGIAEGAGLDIDHLWMALLMEQRAQAGLRMDACTSFALTADRTTFGEPVIARVFDLPPETGPFNVLRRDRPADRLASMQLTFPQLAGSHTGVNERGLAIAYNLGYPCDQSGCSAGITLIVQEILERCGTVGEAIELVPQLRRSGGALLTLADADGDIAAVELTAIRTAVRCAENGCVINTNHYQTDATRPMETGFGAYARPWQRRGWYWIGLSSATRLDRARHLVQARQQWDIDGLITVMADHGPEGVGSDMTICRHAPPYETTFAAILLPTRRAMLIAPGQACCQSFVTRPLGTASPSADEVCPQASHI